MSGQRSQYPVVLERGYRNWSAYVPDLPICVSTGRTRAAVKRNVREATVAHLECLRDSAEPIPEPGTSIAMIQVNVPGEVGAQNPVRAYLVVVEPEADRWSAYVPDLGCTTVGNTRSDVERNIRQELAKCLVSMRKHGEPIPEPGRRTAVLEVEVPSKDSALSPAEAR
jgi:predicted RNase H-like HicB family nuclease